MPVLGQIGPLAVITKHLAIESLTLSITLLMPMQEFGKWLMIGGTVAVVAGFVLWCGVGRTWLGRLPGDIHYTRGSFSFHFPVVTCLLLSALLTLLLWLFRR